MAEESASSSTLLSMDGLDEVEDYVSANEHECMTRETFHHIFELVKNGNVAFRDNCMEEAINFYSRANNIKSGDPVILGNRSAAYIRISQFLKHRSPSASEYKPLNGLDPTTHAELGLKDAEKLVNIQSNFVKPYVLKANALFLLEQYERARDVILSGLQVDPFSVTLKNIIQKNFLEEYAERKQEQDNLINFGRDIIPLFVMDVVIPCQKFPLHIFEPRYRLMVRRIMEGNHRMGMVITDSTTGSVAEFACEVEITECEPLQDGRFYIEVESRRRFRIIQSWDQDGYRVAEVEWRQDIMPSDGTREKDELQELTNEAAEHARSWLRRAKEAARHDQRRLERLLNVEVMMPTIQDPERFSFWVP